jgi:hypothetical protein
MSSSFLKIVSALVSKSSKWLRLLPIVACLGIFLIHFSIIRKNAVNVPFWDDWAAFGGDNHPASIDWPWLFAQHNEHRMSTTKGFIWLQFHLNGWNVRTQLLLNFLTFGLLLIWLGWCGRSWAPQLPFWVMPSFLIFFLTPIIWFNHFMAYTGSVHFWLLSFFLTTYFLFTKNQRWSSLSLACVASILSIYSWAAGFVTSLILLIAFVLFKSVRAYRANERSVRRGEILQLLFSIMIVGGALVTWAHGFHKPTHHPPFTMPYRREFWVFLLNLVAASFGILSVSTGVGFVCLMIVLVPVLGMFWQRRILPTTAYAVCAGVFALLANQCAITIGRAGFGVELSKGAEYVEAGMPLIILAVASWAIFLRGRHIARWYAVLAMWLFFLTTFWPKWHDFGIYALEAQRRMEGVRCVKDYYAGKADGHCPTIYPADRSLAPLLEQAKRLNASVYRENRPR